jgi:hypothetical protein
MTVPTRRPLHATVNLLIAIKIVVLLDITFWVRPLRHPVYAPDGAWLRYNSVA